MAAGIGDRKRSFLKGFGKAWMIFKAIVDAVLARGGGDEEMEYVLTDSTLAGKIADLIVGVGAAAKQVVSRILSIPRPAPFDPVAFIGKGWKVLAGETDNRAVKLTEVDFARVNFETCLNGEPKISGEDKLKRLREGGDILLDSGVFLALWNEEGHKTLNWLHETKGITYLDFFGTILGSPHGYRNVLCLCRDDDGRWFWSCHWLDHDWYAKNFSASLASS